MTIPTSGPLALTDIQTEFGGSNPIGLNEYYAGGGLVPAVTSGTYGAVPTSGQISLQNFYGTTAFTPIYIEEVFQTWLYTGTGANQSIVNGIDFAGKGGMAWLKDRNLGDSPTIFDTVRGTGKELRTQTQGLQTTAAAGTELYQFNSNGFNLGENWNIQLNEPSYLYTSWSFREQPKFFDIVTFTGNGAARTIAHNLGSVPGCIIVKCTTDYGSWWMWHRGLTDPTTGYVTLEATTAEGSANLFGSTLPTSSVFSLGAGASTNSNGQTFIAYIFAHNAGGFGLTGTDDVISCGNFTTNGSGAITVNLGWEPQWLLLKNIDAGYDSLILDNMRGFPTSGDAKSLRPESSASEGNRYVYTNATGFSSPNNLGPTKKWIYIAIRRGPMKVPTDATKVFAPVTYSGDDATFKTITSGFPPDMQMLTLRNEAQTASGTNATKNTISRLTGLNTVSTNTNSTPSLFTSTGGAETNIYGYMNFFQNTFAVTSLGGKNGGGRNYVTWNFRRAPSFFDVVCYTGNKEAGKIITHNLSVAPELLIVKLRSGGGEPWNTLVTPAPAGSRLFYLNTTLAGASESAAYDIFGTASNTYSPPTATSFQVGANNSINNSGATYIAYLFATCAGVSKVGSYTGNGGTQTINCGFTSGARFVMIKRTDSGGSWFVFDTARGMTSTNPFLQMNNTSEELTTSGAVTTVATGFGLDAGASGLATTNISGASYIFLAIA